MKLTYRGVVKGEVQWVDEDHRLTMPEWQMVRYRDMMEMYEAMTQKQASYNDAKFMLWLASWDDWTVTTFKKLIGRIHNRG